MLVSVVIPSFNRPESTWRAVRSVLSQRYSRFEIVIVDDASAPPLDASELEALDDRVRCFRLERNGGAAAARQYGVDRSRGDAIAFLDSDDRWSPEKLERQVALLNGTTRELIAVACGWSEHRPDGKIERRRIPVESAIASDFASGCWFCPGSTIIVSRATFDHVGPIDMRLRRLEDFDWFARFGLAGGAIASRTGIFG